MRHHVVLLCSTGLLVAASAWAEKPEVERYRFADPSGVVETISQAGEIELDSPFFRSLGTNGRSCGSCHQPADGMSVSAQHIQQRFNASNGLDPIFRPVDGANCDSADVSTVAARRQAYSLLLNRGLIRVALDVPAAAEFSVETVLNPYGCGSRTTLSVYRRPLASANLRFLSTVMWDGRESHAGNTLEQNLSQQAIDATLGHAQGLPPGPTPAQVSQIVAFELGLYAAQAQDHGAGALDAQGARGGALPLLTQAFFIGINDPVGLNPTGTPFNPAAFDVFDAWAAVNSPERCAIARGQALFNTKPIVITGVGGLNGKFGLPASFTGNCTTCHDSPNVGNHSISAPLNIGLTDPGVAGTDGLPVITLVNRTTGARVTTTDPGRALVSGKWEDVGKTKGPILRGLAARAPYFHNGSAATLLDAVNFYETRFHIGLTEQEKADLVAFLGSL